IGIAKLGNSTYRFENFDMDTVMLGASINPGDIETASGNLLAFKARAVPRTLFQLIPSGSSKRTYDLISRTLALSTSSMDTFYRLFLVTGMHPRSRIHAFWPDGHRIERVKPL
ncbi:hypothetical protein E4T56_gene19800, partial [Termitomyces sp. T112]